MCNVYIILPLKIRQERCEPVCFGGVYELHIFPTDIVKRGLTAFLSTFSPGVYISSILFPGALVEVQVIGPHLESQL